MMALNRQGLMIVACLAAGFVGGAFWQSSARVDAVAVGADDATGSGPFSRDFASQSTLLLTAGNMDLTPSSRATPPVHGTPMAQRGTGPFFVTGAGRGSCADGG